MKRKAIALCLLVAVAAIAIAGTSLAYFTDKDQADNVFVVGNVKIQLLENFEQNSKLLPATGSVEDGTLQNAIVKEVDVKNTGTEPAYARVHIAVPAVLDAQPNPLLHFTYSEASLKHWSWEKTSGGLWNSYNTTIDGIVYHVYVVTYRQPLAPASVTEDHAIYQVFLDSRATGDDVAELNEILGENWEIKVLAEGVQSAGFSDAFSALDTAFGVPGTYDAF